MAFFALTDGGSLHDHVSVFAGIRYSGLEQGVLPVRTRLFGHREHFVLHYEEGFADRTAHDISVDIASVLFRVPDNTE